MARQLFCHFCQLFCQQRKRKRKKRRKKEKKRKERKMSRQLFCHFTFCQQRKKEKKEKIQTIILSLYGGPAAQKQPKKNTEKQERCPDNYFVTLQLRKTKTKNDNNVFWITAIWRPFTQNNVSMVLASMTSRGRPFQSLMVLGRNEPCWYWVLQCGCQNCWLCLRRSQRALWWWLGLVLNSISGNYAVVDSVQHCQPIYQIIVIF